MKHPGQVILFPFPYTDQSKSKLRPALLIAKTPGEFNDFLICMISTQLHHEIKGFDEIIKEKDKDFSSSGLKMDSVIRLGRLAVIDGNLLKGSIGTISSKRLKRIRRKFSKWIKEDF